MNEYYELLLTSLKNTFNHKSTWIVVGVLNLLQVSSSNYSNVSWFCYLSLLSVSISPLIFVTISLSISRIASSVSSLAFFSCSTAISIAPIYSSAFSLTIRSLCSLYSCSFLTISWTLGKSFSRHPFNCSTYSYLMRDSLVTSCTNTRLNLSSII